MKELNILWVIAAAFSIFGVASSQILGIRGKQFKVHFLFVLKKIGIFQCRQKYYKYRLKIRVI